MARFDALVLIRGAGALGSGLAYRLTKAGFPVVMTELAAPLVLRSTVSYGPCIYYHSVIVEGIVARHAEIAQVHNLLAQGNISVLVDPGRNTIAALHPAVVIDARGDYIDGDTTIHDAPLVIGLGPAFTAGVNCHKVIDIPPARPLTHVLLSPGNGVTLQVAMIGERVNAGALIACVGNEAVRAPIAGVLSGLIDNDIQLTIGSKLGLINPDIRREDCFTISNEALAVGGEVLDTILNAPQLASEIHSSALNLERGASGEVPSP